MNHAEIDGVEVPVWQQPRELPAASSEPINHSGCIVNPEPASATSLVSVYKALGGGWDNKSI